MELLKMDLLSVSYAYMVFALAFTANILFSLYYNIKVDGQDFNKYLLWSSIKKAFVFIVATFMLVVAVDAIVLFFALYAPEMSDSVQQAVSVLMVVSTIGRAALKYIIEAYNTFVNVLNGKQTETAEAITAGN